MQQLMAPQTAGSIKTVGSKKPARVQRSISLQIRMVLVQTLRGIRHYSNHLAGLVAPVDELARISYNEDKPTITLDEEEKAADARQAEEELEALGPIGFKNAKEPYMAFPEAIAKIDGICKQLCQTLYTGENLKYLEGQDKIPRYLSIFLEQMKKQAEGFRINQVRQLRTLCLKLVEIAEHIPRCVFHYLKTKFKTRIDLHLSAETAKFQRAKAEFNARKEEHLRLFRPNLANPANKQQTLDLDGKEKKRNQDHLDVSIQNSR